jgi:siroheme synthase (precorrin-2 oxidase/ferrochelatase)
MIKEKKVIWVQKNIREETAEQQITQIWKILKETYPNCFQKEKRFSMVFACTNRRNINRKIYEYCKQRNIQVNTADRRQESDFYFPGLLEYEDVIIGVTGNGKNHKKVKTVMDKLREVFNKNI